MRVSAHAASATFPIRLSFKDENRVVVAAGRSLDDGYTPLRVAPRTSPDRPERDGAGRSDTGPATVLTFLRIRRLRIPVLRAR